METALRNRDGTIDYVHSTLVRGFESEDNVFDLEYNRITHRAECSEV